MVTVELMIIRIDIKNCVISLMKVILFVYLFDLELSRRWINEKFYYIKVSDANSGCGSSCSSKLSSRGDFAELSWEYKTKYRSSFALRTNFLKRRARYYANSCSSFNPSEIILIRCMDTGIGLHPGPAPGNKKIS